MRIRTLLVLSCALAALGLVPDAQAKVWFESMRGQRVEPFALVSTEIAGCNGSSDCLPELTGTAMFSKPVRAGHPRACGATRNWAPAGRISRRATLLFRAPERPGRYELVAAVYDGTRCALMGGSPPFVVTAPKPG